MKKQLLLFWFLILSFGVKAQLDTEHWFAPMFDRASTNSYYSNASQQYLFLSTNETTPFDVEIYSGNTLLTTIRGLKKGSPKEYFVSRRYIISQDFTELGKSKRGLYLKGPKKFFANLRFSTFNHAEILTSKGHAGIGTKFYAVVAPITVNTDNVNFMLGVLATEDNTKVMISGYNPQVRFTNISPTPQSIEVTLNKGEAYTLEGGAGYNANKTGFIGAKIESNKPISVTNGNFNGQYSSAADVRDGTDIIMDQSVPVERLGNEFAIVKGNGRIGERMEGALIVATENNTEIYVNNETTPIKTLNEGEYYIVPETKFRSQRGHYNLYIRATKNIYLYQTLGGIEDSLATEGFNYIPPLNCFLPHQIGEIGSINVLYGNGGFGEYDTVPTKLNFTTMKGATVNVEGYTLRPEHGPFDLLGTNDWVTYSIPNVKGNINITSTKSITAGISAGSGHAGYGGYFAGFSTVVRIKKNGECIPNITLEVDGDFDAYQWKKDGVNITGATAKTYKPTEPGKYTVEITSSTCSKITAEVEVLNCVKETTITENTCGAKVFIPKFSQSKQKIDLATLKIIKQPTKGQLSIDAVSGQITYTPNAGETGQDTFVYKFCGIDAKYPDCEEVTVNLVLNKIVINNAVIITCPINGKGVFNLTTANIGQTPNDVVKYYLTALDATNGTNEIANPMVHSSTEGKIYAKVVSQQGCSGVVEIELKFYELPKININLYNSIHCDDDFDGIIHIDFSKITPIIVGNGVNVKYYPSQSDAENDNNPLPNNWSYTQNTEVFVKATNTNSCHSIDKILFQIKDKLSLLKDTHTEKICDTDFDASVEVDLANYTDLFFNNASSKTYYSNLADAQNSRNAITSRRRVNNGEIFFIRLGDGNSCDNIATLKFEINVPKASQILVDKQVCPAEKTTLDAGAGYASYLWSTGATTQTISVGAGDYWVELTTNEGCKYRQNVSVTDFPFNQLNNAILKVCPVNGKGLFDLTTANIGNVRNSTVRYYPTTADATNETNEITNPTAYTSTEGKVYAKVISQQGCAGIAEISLNFYDLPTINLTLYTAHCDDDFDGIIHIDFSKITPVIVGNGINVKYYLSPSDAENDNNPLPDNWSYTQNTEVFVKAISKEGCSTIEKINFMIKRNLTLLKQEHTAQFCSNEDTNINLNNYISVFSNQRGVIAKFFNTLNEAQNGNNPINPQINLTQNKTYFVRLESADACPNIAQLHLMFNQPVTSATLKDVSICKDETVTLDAGAGYLAYLWSTGETSQTINTRVGNYWVELTSPNGCIHRQSVNVTEFATVKILNIDIKDQTATINVDGNPNNFQYSLDGKVYQDSNVFTGLKSGIYSIFVKAKNSQCPPSEQQFSIISLTNFITPNGDGLNDVIDYSLLMLKQNAKFNVYDRYGALVFEGTPLNKFTWDGKAKGRPLPTTSYWYLIEWQEPNTNTWVKTASWILLKNRD